MPPPEAVSVALLPEQTALGPVMAALGSGFTVTDLTAVAVQLLLLVTVTV